MTTIIPCKAFAGAVIACAACLEKDTMHHHPGRMRITRSADALVLATATRTEKVKLTFRIPCEPGEAWVAVVDADGTSRLAKAMRPLASGKKNSNATIEIERTERSLVLVGGGQRMSVPACEPMLEETTPTTGETFSVAGAADLPDRIAQAMVFANPGEYRSIARGPFAYFSETDGELTVPAVVATDGHRLFVDGDAGDCRDAKIVFQVPGDDWKPATKALATDFDTVRLVRTSIPQPADENGKKPPEKWLTRLVFEAADRRVELAVVEPEISLPHWASFVPRETNDPDFSITCDREELAAAVKAVSSVSHEKNAACMLRADPAAGILRILAQTDNDGGMAQREIPAEVGHSPTKYVHLNGRYMLDCLAAVRTDRVRLFQHSAPLDSVRVIEVAPEGTRLRMRGMVIMPIRGIDPVEEATATGADAERAAVEDPDDATVEAASSASSPPPEPLAAQPA
ncbi:MAG: hypothetical protein HY905_04100 [Deltaproteobacteria bacterium]|nr:hypothetical protein [Deltaproteobacteria bacterium]